MESHISLPGRHIPRMMEFGDRCVVVRHGGKPRGGAEHRTTWWLEEKKMFGICLCIVELSVAISERTFKWTWNSFEFFQVSACSLHIPSSTSTIYICLLSKHPTQHGSNCIPSLAITCSRHHHTPLSSIRSTTVTVLMSVGRWRRKLKDMWGLSLRWTWCRWFDACLAVLIR